LANGNAGYSIVGGVNGEGTEWGRRSVCLSLIPYAVGTEFRTIEKELRRREGGSKRKKRASEESSGKENGRQAMCVKLLRTHILFECVCLRFFFVPNYRCKSVGLRSPFPSPPFLIFSLFPFPSDGREKQILFRVTEPASRLTSSFGFSARGVSTSSLVSMWNQQLLPRSSIPCHVSRIPVRARVELSHSKVRQT